MEQKCNHLFCQLYVLYNTIFRYCIIISKKLLLIRNFLRTFNEIILLTSWYRHSWPQCQHNQCQQFSECDLNELKNEKKIEDSFYFVDHHFVLKTRKVLRFSDQIFRYLFPVLLSFLWLSFFLSFFFKILAFLI